jgi:hypothetical protein
MTFAVRIGSALSRTPMPASLDRRMMLRRKVPVALSWITRPLPSDSSMVHCFTHGLLVSPTCNSFWLKKV